MKIALVSEHASPLAVLGGVDAGGQNVHIAELSAALRRRGHDVTVYTRRDDARTSESVVTTSGYEVISVPAGPPHPMPKDELLPYMDEFGEFLAGHWRHRPPDIVHAHFWMSGLAALAAAQPAGIPVVQTFHALGVVKRRYQGADDTSPPDRIRLERHITEQVDRIIATCTDEVFELTRMGVPPTRTSVIPCGVDLERFTPGGPAAPRSARHWIVSVGRLVPRKGFDTAITALGALPGTELVLAGGPQNSELATDGEARRLQRLATELGVQDQLRMLGRVPKTRIPALLRSADAVVCTPWYEPFGMTPLEAMGCGVPVVSCAVGGLIDTVVDGVTGRLVTPRDPAELAAAVGELLAAPETRAAYGRAGRDRVTARYSWERIAAETDHVYRRVLGDTLRSDHGKRYDGELGYAAGDPSIVPVSGRAAKGR